MTELTGKGTNLVSVLWDTQYPSACYVAEAGLELIVFLALPVER